MIEPITSLADLEFRAKTDNSYKKLAVLGLNSFGFTYKSYSHAIKKLHFIKTNWGYMDCVYITERINGYRRYISKKLY